MRRRQFNNILSSAALGGLSEQARAAGSSPDVLRPDSIKLSRNGWMPNNEHLPVLLYRNAFNLNDGNTADRMEAQFQRNGWPPQWRDGVYDFHHYHSTAHEVLGFAGGRAKLILGGENGRTLEVRAGDVAVLPTGIGHCKLEASSDFLVIGAYPPDQHWDICRSAPSKEAIARMSRLPFPNSDPVSGANGPLTTIWRAT